MNRVLLSIVSLVALTPIVGLHFVNLWRYRPHYEFVPFVVAAAAFLLWRRWPGIRRISEGTWSNSVSWALIALGMLTQLVALALFSPTASVVGFLLVLGGFLIRLVGGIYRPLIGPWLLLWLVVPPPAQIDNQLIRAMQWSTATLVSGILDWGGVEHLLSGFVFQIPDHELFVAEACSGIHSQLVLVAACLVYAVLYGRGLVGTVLLTLASVFWSVAANVTRVVIVVVAAAQFDTDLSSGWIHEVIGFTLLGGGLLMLMSTDRLLRGLFAEIRISTSESYHYEATRRGQPGFKALSESGHPQDLLSRIWNHCISVRSSILDETQSLPRSEAISFKEPRWPYYGLTAMSILIGLVQFLSVAMPKVDLRIEQLARDIDRTWSPKSLAGWSQEDYFTETRDRSSDEGLHSSVWRYGGNSGTLQCQVDYPFVGWHELPNCYRGRGWTQVTREIIRPSPTENTHGPYVEVKLKGPAGESGLLIFSLFDATGKTVDPLTLDIDRKLIRNPLLTNLMGGSAVATSETTLQVQQFSIGAEGNDEIEEKRGSFSEFRSAIHQRWFSPLVAKARETAEDET